MPVVFDEESGTYRVILNPLFTIDEAVIILLGKSLVDYPFVYYDEFGNHEETYGLEDYLQLFYDNGEEHLCNKGLEYHELILDAIECGDLVQHCNKLRGVKLIEWAKERKIEVNANGLFIEKLQASNKKPTLTRLRKAAITRAFNNMDIQLPVTLPDKDAGASGIKAEIWEVVRTNNNIFPIYRRFDKAWIDMRNEGLILGGLDKKPSRE